MKNETPFGLQLYISTCITVLPQKVRIDVYTLLYIEHPTENGHSHCDGNAILTKFSSLAALEVVKWQLPVKPAKRILLKWRDFSFSGNLSYTISPVPRGSMWCIYSISFCISSLALSVRIDVSILLRYVVHPIENGHSHWDGNILV